MIFNVSENLIALSSLLNPLYVTGGFVRNALMGECGTDTDITGPFLVAEIKERLLGSPFRVVTEYGRMGTALIRHESGESFEYTTFRKETYERGGGHTPIHVEFVTNLEEDALRRDFTVNAIYYDVSNDVLVDPLGGISDVHARLLRAFRPEQIFASDGLRLLRLARFCGELGFSIEERTKDAAFACRENLADISPERKLKELELILQADEKYPFSPKDGHYRALSVLKELKLFEWLFPTLAKGDGMAQRADYHKFDVLEHSLQTALVAPPEIRLAALLHDIGKPAAFLENGNFYSHDSIGVPIIEKELGKGGLCASNAVVEKTKRLVAVHMADMDCKMREGKVRVLIAKNFDLFEDILALKQADYVAGGYRTDKCPTNIKWEKIYADMTEKKMPIEPSQLAISGKEAVILAGQGNEKLVGRALSALLQEVLMRDLPNDRKTLEPIFCGIIRRML